MNPGDLEKINQRFDALEAAFDRVNEIEAAQEQAYKAVLEKLDNLVEQIEAQYWWVPQDQDKLIY